MKKVLCLDLGTKMGWASPYGSGTVSFANGRFEGGGMRFLKFRKWILDAIACMGGIDAVYFEEVAAHKGTAASHVYGGFMATLTALCEEVGIPYGGVPVGTIKKHATGKGNSNKEKMMAAYRLKFGVDPQDDNETDARFLFDLISTTDGTGVCFKLNK
jgi:hypothetical protein